MEPDEVERVNRRLWDDWAGLHIDADFYDVNSFRAGASSLTPIERAEVGDVAGRSMLHLQCHFGLDTLSWARLGARVTGVDFAPRAIALARSLAHELGLDARFICSSVHDLTGALDERFDIVYTSYGVLPWLPDLDRWARVVAHFLRPGGRLHLIEFHPIADVLGDDGTSFVYPYFTDQPIREVVTGSYADRTEGGAREEITFAHTLADVVNAIIGAGMTLESLREFPFSPWNLRPWMEETGPGEWRMRGASDALPLVYAIRAARPAA